MDKDADLKPRPARPEDIDEVVAFLQPFAAQQFIMRRTPQEIAQLMETGFVTEADGRIIGTGAVEIYSSKLAEIQCLAVDEHYRRRGVGRALVEACVAIAQQQDVRELMAITANDAMFQQCGFHYALPDQKRALFLQTRLN